MSDFYLKFAGVNRIYIMIIDNEYVMCFTQLFDSSWHTGFDCRLFHLPDLTSKNKVHGGCNWQIGDVHLS
jgi:hypothetical protein